MMCLCWRKKSEKNDLLGLDGLVTQMNPDENVNHIPATIPNHVPDDTHAQGDLANDINKRSTTLNSSRRSLPDIPLDGLQVDGINFERNGDNSSDLYATVEPYNSAKRHTLPNGLDTRPSVSQHSSISQADDGLSTYARVKDHPYARLKKTEHPYAHVQPSGSRTQDENNSRSSSRSIHNERVATSQTLSEPSAPSRSTRSSEQVGSDIPAASAVSGGIAASQELPYMTPPIAQPNFSGDSQDSSKGYTSISVREPLANIRAQTKGMHKVQSDFDPHYSTVSDDSDDVYTTIQDPNVIYTSESETYAQIQPVLQNLVEANVSVVEVQRERQVNSNDQVDNVLRLTANEPRKSAFCSHSRQESSSSVSNVGSPKPEKRQANSPLPPPPPSSSLNNLDAVDKQFTFKTVDDMYAKVHKSKKKSDKEESLTSKESSSDTNDDQHPDYGTGNGLETTECSLYTEHNYETLRKTSDPCYERLKPKENDNHFQSTYDEMAGPSSILSSDPGYEALKHSSEISEDPNYEELRHRVPSFSDGAGYSTIGNKLSIQNNLELDGYSVVQKRMNSTPNDAVLLNSGDPQDINTDEPNYESMPSEIMSDHNYATLNVGDCESDSNYESVDANDPNYESVKYEGQTLDEPPYERLQDEDSSKTDSQNSSDKMQTDYCTCASNFKCTNNMQCSNNTKTSNVKENEQFETSFDGIVQV
ncbi:hypothetical protein FQA39_LY06169 [Lamprigera yunnana]|nr:hypothetical protein FQA39_LY06169 [Lamprigera yunnana]